MKRNPDSSPLLIYKASAGSGKTYQLALKYITLLIGEFDAGGRYHLLPAANLNRHREILAITFTNKATQEMKQRIIKELRLLANPEAPSKYRKDIRALAEPAEPALTRAELDSKISVAASGALVSMLFNLGEMNVSTIDSFFQRVLRSFAYEADLSGNYDLMLENKLITDMAIDNMLAMACGLGGVRVPAGVSVGYLKERVKNLIVDAAQDKKQYQLFSADNTIRSELIQFVYNLSGEEYQARKEQISAFLKSPQAIKTLTSALKREKNIRQTRIAALVDSIVGLDGLNISANGLKLLTKWREADFDSFTKANLAILLGKSPATSILNKKGNDASALLGFEASAAELIEVSRLWLSINVMLAQMNFMGLFREILEVERSLKVRTNTIMLSDTNELLHRIIDGSDTPFIYERIGQRLRHFLIDEFQDTSQMQWKNLVPLLLESLGSSRQNLVIGDVKQCIYRFRNSDPELLQNLEQSGELSAYRNDICSVTMDTNWRSSSVVVGFNNDIFSRISATSGVSASKVRAYVPEGVCQKPSRTDLPGYVDVALVKDPGVDGFDRMAENIRRELDAGYPASQIVVLVRTNSQARKVVDFLLGQTLEGGLLEGQSVLSDEALMVASSSAVQWIVGKLHRLDMLDLSPEKRLDRRGLPQASLTDVDRMQEILDRLNADGTENPLEEMISEFNRRRLDTESERDLEAELAMLSNGLSLYELVEELVRALPNSSLRQRDAQFISAFQDLVYDYCATKAPTLHGFMQLWDGSLADKAAVGLSDGIEAIRVMTIHKSKGLEFAAVHLPDVSNSLADIRGHRWFETTSLFEALDWEGPYPRFFPLEQKGGSGNLLATCFSDEMNEVIEDTVVDELNALYVAFTRAKQELIITIKDSTTKEAGGFAPHTPAALLVPVLEELRPSGGENRWQFGTPTEKFDVETVEADFDRLPLDCYDVEPRRDIWAMTKVAETDDSGLIL